jgi:hypothetical protein
MAMGVETVLLAFPARALGPEEQAVLAAWLAAAQDVALAYISQRKGDDPMLFNKIHIRTGPERSLSYTVHSPAGIDCWLVISVIPIPVVERFGTFRSALNSIRRVLP